MARTSKTEWIYDHIWKIMNGQIEDRGFLTAGWRSIENPDEPDPERCGKWVSRLIINRFEQNEPLNPIEEESFATLKKSPQILEEFISLADQVAARGFHRYSARAIIEQLRWASDITQTLKLDEDATYILSDHVTSTCSRIYNEVRVAENRTPLFEIRSAGRIGEDW